MIAFDDWYLDYKDGELPIPDSMYTWLKQAFDAGRHKWISIKDDPMELDLGEEVVKNRITGMVE